jgi:hypothetical protein
MSVQGDRDERLERMLEEDGVDPGADLRELLRAARRARRELSEGASRELLERVLAATRATPRRRVGSLTWAAGLAAAASVMAVLWPGERTGAPGGRIVVKELFFESIHQGEVARLEMTLYRVDRRQ